MINTIGLVLDVFGAWLLLLGELRSDAAFLRYSGTGEGSSWFASQLTKLSWWKKVPISLAVALGSKNPIDMGQESKFDSFPIKFWGIVFLTLGFLLQAIGSFTYQR
jgi:hypothetical protein